jgi:hypothetical protein
MVLKWEDLGLNLHPKNLQLKKEIKPRTKVLF